MKPLIYYPNFEPPNEIWLKFALLYFNEFRPIIPYSKENMVSDSFKQVRAETNLINPINPGYYVGVEASIKAKNEIEDMRSSPYERVHQFNEVNIIRRFQNKKNWGYEIFEEKFSVEWRDYVLSNAMGRQTQNGLLMSQELAFVFMSYLASEIAYIENTAIVTDNNAFDNFTNARRMNHISTIKRNNFAKGIINLSVPKNLSKIPIKKLIKFRNDNYDQIKAFNSELDNVEEKIGDGFSERDFINSYNDIYSDYNKKVIGQGTGLLTIPFTLFTLIKNPLATSINYIKDIMGMLGIAYGGNYALRKGLVDIENERNCKKYLTSLERLA